MSVADPVELLRRLDCAGVAVEARGTEDIIRLTEFLQSREDQGDGFNVVSAFLAHRFDRFGLSDAGHRAAIDRLAGTGADLWAFFRNDNGTVTHAELKSMVLGILDYAIANRVRVALYPHINKTHTTAKDALAFVDEIDRPAFGLAIKFTHALQSQTGELLAQNFERVAPKFSQSPFLERARL